MGWEGAVTLEIVVYTVLVLFLAWRWWRRGTAIPVHPEDAARMPALREAVALFATSGGRELDLSRHTIRVLPRGELEPAAPTCTSVRLCAGSSGFRLDPLMELPGLASVAVVGSVVVPNHWLDVLSTHSALREVDLTGCRVKDSNNSATGLCSGRDLLTWCRTQPCLHRFAVPSLASVQVGIVCKVFSKANVAVVMLTQPIRLGDILELRRVEHSFDSASRHHWSSAQSTITSIRTSAGEQVTHAEPAPRPQRKARQNALDEDGDSEGDEQDDHSFDKAADEASQFAVKLEESGRKGDLVFWCGVGTVSPP